MSKEAKITSISMSGYYSDAYISVTVQTDEGINYFNLKGDEAQQMKALAWQLIEKKKEEMARSILQIQTPVALQAPMTKMIEGKEEEGDDPF